MQLHFNADWLRSQIVNEPDISCDIGTPVCRAEDFIESTNEVVSADVSHTQQEQGTLGLFVHQLRRRDKLSIKELADRIRVDEEEIEGMEVNSAHDPEPRTFHQLADYARVSATGLVRLSQKAANADEELGTAALKFAASSEDLSALSRTERRGLNDFVRFLSNYKGKKNTNVR
ncbi:MAG TPA: hypothetical protein DD827_02410 [Gammaproteobacteria bacterium]|jgi:transcriptional regulator with XRE-family HTH domain|nr:hypothetical protein [Gammaproteobacteria bacterium]